MSSRKLPSKPTEAELAILQVLWQQGPSTVRQVQDLIGSQRGTGYTTTLKLMQIMFEKGLLQRDASSRSHVYSAAVSQQKTQKLMVSNLIDQVFNGSARQLVLQALSSSKSTAEELSEIRELLDTLEQQRRDS